MLHRQPVAIEVKPIVVGTSSWPGLVEFALCWISIHVVRLVGVDPGSKAVETVRVDGRIQKEHHVLEVCFDFIGRSKVIGCK